MQQVSEDVEQGVEAEAAAWDRVVNDHSEAVWEIGRRAGLTATESAVVSQLNTLRLAQRWPALYPTLGRHEVARPELRGCAIGGLLLDGQGGPHDASVAAVRAGKALRDAR